MEEQKPEPAVYDPKKYYGWEPDAIFTLNGPEFGLILNTLRRIISTPEAQNILMAHAALQETEDILKRAVEKGIAKETKKKPS